MKINDRVTTEYGPGEIIGSEGIPHTKSFRLCVKLDSPPEDFSYMQEKYGGLHFWPKELSLEIII